VNGVIAFAGRISAAHDRHARQHWRSVRDAVCKPPVRVLTATRFPDQANAIYAVWMGPKRTRMRAHFYCRLTKPAETSLFEAKLPHHAAALRSVLPPEPYPLPERCYPRVFASVSHIYRLKLRRANGTPSTARRVPKGTESAKCGVGKYGRIRGGMHGIT
jgi:hypothetical protein